jgi:hypothetical protein
MAFLFVHKSVVAMHAILVMSVGRKIMKKARKMYICPSPDACSDSYNSAYEKLM